MASGRLLVARSAGAFTQCPADAKFSRVSGDLVGEDPDVVQNGTDFSRGLLDVLNRTSNLEIDVIVLEETLQ